MSIPTSNQTIVGDVVDLLVAQHHEVRQLFSSLESGGADATEAFQCLVRLLAVHETAEEEVVYPALKAAGEDGQRVAEARKAEEDEAKTQLAELERMGVDDPDFRTSLEAFRAAVSDHADAEERQVFPLLRRSYDAEELKKMRKALERAERMAPTHPHPHGPESGIGNLVVGPFVAIVDRVRDAIRDARS